MLPLRGKSTYPGCSDFRSHLCLATFRDNHVSFQDYDRLASLAGFDDAYLDQTMPLLRQP